MAAHADHRAIAPAVRHHQVASGAGRGAGRVRLAGARASAAVGDPVQATAVDRALPIRLAGRAIRLGAARARQDHPAPHHATNQQPPHAGTIPHLGYTFVAACELDLRAKSARKRADAAKRCDAALAAYPGATRALILLAAAAANDRRDTVAEKHLRRAVVLDPTDPVPWGMLARLYRATHASQRLSELESQHQALFSTPLPK